MSQSSSHPESDRNLLFGVLALQTNFIGRDALVNAMQAWALDKRRPLGQILLEQNKLTPDQVAALEAVLVQHLRQHGDDAEQSLRALQAASTAPPELASLKAAAGDSTSARIASDPTVEETLDLRRTSGDGGRYRRLRHYADGGLGTVFVAEDCELRREVALKEIKPAQADSPECRNRFTLEAMITGRLEHPGIVPVYGLGQYANGRPYYAMRFIRGGNLREAIEKFHAAQKPGRDSTEQSLAFRRLLRRFIDVCNAVAFAHSRGVLHRDLKPANVMLGEFGETLVVDWGLAKFASAENSAARETWPDAGSLDMTDAGSAVGTPPYMSPEQAAGDHGRVAATSDVYSLGSILYTLLTGKRPFDAKEKEDVLSQVRAGKFKPPREVNRLTPPALDAICRKAMSFQPADRYPTGLALAADIEHWLADEPVEAYPEPWPTRAGRWGRRHRTALVAALVLLVTAVVALSASTGLIWAEQVKTAREKKRAEDNFSLARDLSLNGVAFIESSQTELASNPKLYPRRKEILVTAARSCRTILERQPNDVEVQSWAAQVYRYTANFHRLSSQPQEALPLYEESVKLYQGLTEKFDSEQLPKERLAETLRDYAKLQSMLGRLVEASDSLGRSVEIVEKLRSTVPDANLERSLGVAKLDLATVQYSRLRLDEAKARAKESADLLRGLSSAPPEQSHPYDPLLLAAALSLLASAEREAGQFDDARPIHNEAIGVLMGLVERKKQGVDLTVNMADVRHLLALCRLEQCRTWLKTPMRRANAEKNLAATAQEWEKLAAEFPLIPMYREALGTAYQMLGQIRTEDGKLSAASGDLENSRKLLVNVVESAPSFPASRAELGRTYLVLGKLAAANSDQGAAADWFAKAAKELGEAAKQSPDNLFDARSLQELPKDARSR